MSRAFIKEDDGAGDELAELPISPYPNRMTSGGLAALRQRLGDTERRLGASAGIAFDADLERARLARDLRWLRARVASAIVISAERESTDRVGFGATVDVVELESKVAYQYRIVGEDEADPERGAVSWISPLARALDGASVGDVVTWPRPAGDLELEIIAIRYAA